MSNEQRLTPTTTGHAPDHTGAHSYFVGRRGSDAAEVYEVTETSVERLRSRRRYGESSLDWRGSDVSQMELSHLLISRVTKQRPSRDLMARFSLYFLTRLAYEGFVLDSDGLSRWLRIAGDDHESVPAPPPRRSWLGQRRARFGGSPRQANRDI
jgi:hypothetical protein